VIGGLPRLLDVSWSRRSGGWWEIFGAASSAVSGGLDTVAVRRSRRAGRIIVLHASFRSVEHDELLPVELIGPMHQLPTGRGSVDVTV